MITSIDKLIHLCIEKWNITEMLRLVAASKITSSINLGNRIRDHDHDDHHDKSTWPPSDNEHYQINGRCTLSYLFTMNIV